jgi:hypothetical protein
MKNWGRNDRMPICRNKLELEMLATGLQLVAMKGIRGRGKERKGKKRKMKGIGMKEKQWKGMMKKV